MDFFFMFLLLLLCIVCFSAVLFGSEYLSTLLNLAFNHSVHQHLDTNAMLFNSVFTLILLRLKIT